MNTKPQKIRIGDICNVRTGKLDANASSPTGAYPFFTCSRETLRIDHYAYDCECVLIAGNGELNAKYYNGKFNAYQRTYIISLKPGVVGVSVKYLYIFFSSYIETLRSKSIGGVIKYIKMGDITDALVSLPSYEEQTKIVSECKLLIDIIENKKKQLQDMENLSVSLFYEMFGDPVNNELNWESRTLKSVCERLYAGGDVPIESFSKTKDDIHPFPIYSNGKGESALYGFTGTPREESPAITISGRGTIGYSCIRYEPFFPIIRLIVAVPFDKAVNIVFLQKHISLMKLESTGGAIPQLTIPMIRDRQIILPPIDLQAKYAEKVEYIEKQKKLVTDSLFAVETLFNSRLDFWFS